MAFSNTEITQIEQCMDFFMKKRRPAPFIRDEVDLQYRIDDQSVIICEVRNVMERIIESPVVKITLNRTRRGWKVFGMSQSHEWVAVFDKPLQTFSDAIRMVEDDECGCFFG
ncbi:hypothetical protein CKG00_02545 [Morganella morganii]|uniref:DUF3024 domain-containing protein n=1 Tax=Morganella morganii TaxID=582 RepID=A0A433ZTG3_MORMO|nr:DUF3024 domain-containing protein [Morganella morganii]RUT65401.1 hypothetical protein CKG00_02545 [Morganella morganii]